MRKSESLLPLLAVAAVLSVRQAILYAVFMQRDLASIASGIANRQWPLL